MPNIYNIIINSIKEYAYLISLNSTKDSLAVYKLCIDLIAYIEDEFQDLDELKQKEIKSILENNQFYQICSFHYYDFFLKESDEKVIEKVITKAQEFITNLVND
ncbi:MAG: hypothetical protein ACK5Z5_07685 [Neisseriaceae bacterium]